MKIKPICLALSFLIVSVTVFASAPGDVVTCSYSDGFSWSNAASEQWTVNDMVEHCLSGGGTATVNRPTITQTP